MKAKRQLLALGLLIAAVLTALPAAEGRIGRLLDVRMTPVAKNVYMLAGAGGNVGLLAGEDGVLLVDADLAAMNDKLTDAVKEICPNPIRLVINTHWHFDHVEGNERLARQGALIVAHENVAKRVSTEQVIGHIERRVPPSPEAARPVITYPDTLTVYRNGEEVRVIHVPPAHTDGDSLVYFCKANVLHMGDIYFAGTYPFIDVHAGGSIDGMLNAVDYALKLVDENTQIIPGHGPLSSVADLRAYRQMLATVRDRVQALIKEGKSRVEIIAAKPTRDLDVTWGRGTFDPDKWVAIVYDGMVRK